MMTAMTPDLNQYPGERRRHPRADGPMYLAVYVFAANIVAAILLGWAAWRWLL
jgi:hypothetical protein